MKNNALNSLWAVCLLLLTTLPVTAAEVVTFYHNDQVGSPIAATDATGALVWEQAYGPWGKKLTPNTESRAFTGNWRDSETGLADHQARWYNPSIGRFNSIDPVGWTPESIHSFNRYTYGNNNPYKFTDVDGEFPLIPVLVWAGLEALGVAVEVATMEPTQDAINRSGLGVPGIPALKASKTLTRTADAASSVTKGAGNGANSATNALKLEKQLASQEQLGQLSKGGGTVISQPAKQADRIASQTGRNPANIQKVSSDARVAGDGQQIQTHSFRDASTNKLIEPKTIIGD